jgi:hypothetical protein
MAKYVCVLRFRASTWQPMRIRLSARLATHAKCQKATQNWPVQCFLIQLTVWCFRQLDLAPFDLLFWPHPLVLHHCAPGRSEALRRP